MWKSRGEESSDSFNASDLSGDSRAIFLPRSARVRGLLSFGDLYNFDPADLIFISQRVPPTDNRVVRNRAIETLCLSFEYESARNYQHSPYSDITWR